MKTRPPAMLAAQTTFCAEFSPSTVTYSAVEHAVGVELGQLLDHLALRGDGIGGHHVGAAEQRRLGGRAVAGDDLASALGRDARHRRREALLLRCDSHPRSLLRAVMVIASLGHSLAQTPQPLQ